MVNYTASETSNRKVSLGANYVGWDNQYNLRLWAYEFENYGELFYVDNSIKFKPIANLAFNIASRWN